MLNLFQHPTCRTIGARGKAMKQPCVYMLASEQLGTIYIGVTADLVARLHQHRTGTAGFASRYGAIRLVRYELFADMPSAIAREKQMKRWHRDWKIELIRSENPDWVDLAEGLGLAPVPFRARGSLRHAGP